MLVARQDDDDDILAIEEIDKLNVFKSWTRLIAFHIALIPLGKV